MSELILWFSKSQDVSQLEKTLFVNSSGIEILAVRGKTSGAYKNSGSFQWTPGVKALAVIFINALARHLKRTNIFLPLLEGNRGSLAASLDYALNKQPEWLFDMFGSDTQGNAYLRHILFKSNSGLRRAGPVGISLNENLLEPQSIKIYFENRLISDPEELERLGEHIINTQQNVADYPNLLVLDSLNTSISDLQDESIYLFEQLQIPESCATSDRLISWKNGWGGALQTTLPSAIDGRIVQAKQLFEELTYRTCDEKTKTQFEEWLYSMTMEKDGEYGQDLKMDGEPVPGFLSWIKEHHTSDSFTSNSLYQTFIWRDRTSKEIVGTISLVPDDRGVKAKYGLPGAGLIGGPMVHWNLRSRGIGKYICARINRHISEFAKQQGKPVSIHLFTRTFGPMQPINRLLEHLRFSRNPIGSIKTSVYGAAPLWSRQYAIN